jgi:serine protease AprX
MWYRRFLLGCITGILLVGNAAAEQYAFQIAFTDKNGQSLSNPLSFLSQRAIDRRTAQGITLDSTDLPVSAAYIDSVLTLTGGVYHESSRWLNMCVILLSDSSQILKLQNKSYISSIVQVAYYGTELHERMSEGYTGGRMQPTGSSNGTNAAQEQRNSSANKTTNDAAYYGSTYQQTALVNGTCLNDRGFKGQGKLIAILDAGFIGADTNPGFDSLRQSGRIADEHNFTLATDNVYESDDHGMLVLSTMAGYIPNSFVGAAPLASYALYITEDDNSEQPIELFNMIAGAERADSIGADVITESLGYNTFDNPAYNFNFSTDFDGKTTIAARAANFATKKGILFVATAGNQGTDPSWSEILTPGDADSALTIGATDAEGDIASFSGYGPNAAGAIKPDVCADGNDAATFTDAGYNGSNQGTSFSTPQIAGWAACLMQAYGNATPYTIRTAIEKSANAYTTPGSQNGYGVPDFCAASQLLNVKDTPVATASSWITASPNPFTDQISLTVDATVSQDISFRLTDVTGKVVASQEQFFSKGYNAPVQMVLGGHLPAGIYILKAVSNTQQQVVKLEKL